MQIGAFDENKTHTGSLHTCCALTLTRTYIHTDQDCILEDLRGKENHFSHVVQRKEKRVDKIKLRI